MTMTRDGGLQGMEVKGDLQLLITDESLAKCVVPLVLGENPGFQFKTHPNINKQLFASTSVLGLKDPARPFPTEGAPLGVLKWRLQTNDSGAVPMLINCWPNAAGGDRWDVNVEYELQAEGRELHNVTVSVPSAATPTITSTDAGEAVYSKRDGAITWTIPIIDSSATSGSFEFHVEGVPSADAFFPITVGFRSPKTLCDVAVTQVRAADDGTVALPYSATCALSVEQYTIV